MRNHVATLGARFPTEISRLSRLPFRLQRESSYQIVYSSTNFDVPSRRNSKQLQEKWIHVGYLYHIISPSSSWSHKHVVSPPNLPESGQSEGPYVQPKSVDKSEDLFTTSMYLERSDEEDRETTERWKRECDVILIFVSHSYQLSPY